MKELKRILSFVLCFVMLLGLFPAGVPRAAAAEDTIYVLAGGDFQEAGAHANSAENVTNILTQIGAKYDTMDGFLFIGDYDCETHNDATETANGITALMGAVQGTYSNLSDANSVLVQGNHDYMDSRIDTTGGHEFEGYAVFVLNEDDYPDAGGSESGVQALAATLETWLSGKIDEGYSAPIFVTSHLPLAFGPRTNNKGDGKYAKYLFDVLNTAAEEGLNIIFMHGHDHAYGADNYLGGEAIYLAKGDKINIAEVGSQTAWTEETLNFTYMNAGYVGYYNESGYTPGDTDDTKLTMTVFAITDSQVAVERYSADGLYNLKSSGRDGYYASTSSSADNLGLVHNKTVYASPQTITLTNASTGGDMGTIGQYVGVAQDTGSDDVTTSGGSWAEITAPVPGAGATPDVTTYQYTLAQNGFDHDNHYLIVGSRNDKAMGSGTLTAVDVTIDDSAVSATTDTRDYEWISTSDGKITNGTQYLEFEGNTNSSNGTLSVTNNESDATAWTIRDNGNGSYSIYVSHTYTTRDNCGNQDEVTEYCFLYYNNNAFTTGTSNTESNTSYTVRLYGDVEEIVTPGTEATPDTNGLYGKIAGGLSYTVESGADGDTALEAVMAGVDGYYYEAMNTPGSNVEGTIVDDSALTWTLDENYDGNTPGDYAVTISYGDVVLGTAEVIVPASTVYYVAEGSGLYTVDMNATADEAMAAVKAGVTVFSATDANGSDKTAIEDSEVTWNWVDTFDGKNVGPYTVEVLYDGTSLGTVEVKVDVHYDSGITEGWTYAGTTSTTYRYVLDTDGYETGSNNRYLFVASDAAYAMDEDGTGVVPVTFNADETEATVDSRDYEWYIYQGSIGGRTRRVITKTGSGSFLYHADYTLHLGTNDNGYWTIDENRQSDGLYRFYNADGGSTWYLRYHTDGYMGVTTSTERYLRLYKYDGEIAGGNVYAKIEGNTVYTVTQGKSSTSAMNTVKAGITGYISGNADGSDAAALADSELTWKWLNKYNGNVEGSYWVEISYNGVVLGIVEVKVEPGVVNNYPEYPNEGSVKVSKTGTGIDFQSSGIAQVELSASGVPIKKGADVIVMLDTSSSMTSHTVTGTSVTRADVLEESLKNLIAQFKTPGDDGQLLDLRVAIADFNGFYGDSHSQSGTPYDRDAADMMSDDVSYTANSEAQIYTGDKTLGAGAFVSAADLADSYTLNYTSGTNYDYAMDAIYQMGTAIRESNGTEERDLYVIFMSDGAAMQWNYYHSQGASSLWNNWITGAWTADQLSLNCTEHAYYYDEIDHNGDGMRNEHRMANAIKGDPAETYEVIRKTDTMGTATGEENMYMVPGLGATMFAISFDATTDDQVTEESMDKSIETLASEQTGTTRYYYKVTSADELDDAFAAIGSEIAYAASNARFVDKLGDNYNLQMAPSTYTDVNGDNQTVTPKIEVLSYDIYTRQDWVDGNCEVSQIGDRKGTFTVLETVTFNEDGTEVYSDKLSGNILIDGVICAQSFWFNTTATAKTVSGVSIPTGTKSDGTTTGSTNVLPSETFYWKLGTVQTSELALRYNVYLEGSMEGTRDGGSYSTNEYANLYYDNYLENPCWKETASPVMAWKEANVSYAFYLVNEQGEIIVNQTTGQTGSFANKIAITNPVVHSTLALNSNTDLDAAILAEDVLPSYYDLYDDGAKYTITINSNSTGAWSIAKAMETATTYVTNYNTENAAAYSKETDVDDSGYDYTHTVVWFAVIFTVQAHPDTVVVDYGLPVDISVLTNDMFGENGKLAAVGASSDSLNVDGHDDALADGFGDSYSGAYGEAAVNKTSGDVRYTLKTMQMNGYEKFAYAVNYTGTDNAGYYYDTVTVIPATTIYYEDDFLSLASYSAVLDAEGNPVMTEDEEGYEIVQYAQDTPSKWGTAGTLTADATQAEDRPGEFSLPYIDVNNIYGYDDVNLGMSRFSLGQARKVHVGANSYATAQFTFYGTGFDVIGMTSNTTGILTLDVYPESAVAADGSIDTDLAVKSAVVNTYYGYTTEVHKIVYTYTNGEWVAEDQGKAAASDEATAKPETPAEGDTYTALELVWVATPDAENAIYQVPVMQIRELEYGKYIVVLTATYVEPLDKTTAEGYDLYLDAVRIYDPANNGAADGSTDTTIEDAYKADHEGWPSYIELRSSIIAANTFGNESTVTAIEGLVFIDGDASVGNAQMDDYVSFGPNNEVYLAPGQRVAFLLDTPENIDRVHIGIKSADGESAAYTISNIAKASNPEAGIEAGDYYGANTAEVSTSTDMYYELTGWKNDIIVISNTGDRYGTTGILSLTNIKSTYTSDPGAVITSSEGDASVQAATEEVRLTSVYMTAEAAQLVVASVNADASEEVPGGTEPEETVPEETEPEVTEPEVFEPDLFTVKLSKSSIRVGEKVLVIVTTSEDVDHILVNGTAVTNYTTGSAGHRSWKLNVTGTRTGTMDVEVRCVNEAGVAGKAITKSVEVKPKTFFDLIFDLFR